MKIPSITIAHSLIEEAGAHNPGPWVAHSINVARAAQLIAECHPCLEPEPAYILGLLHDIGRRRGVTGMVHVIDGYNYLQQRGYPDAARISLTHSYPMPDARSGSAPWDGTKEELDFVQAYLSANGYDDYDRLIQLCDSIALPNGFCLMEKRLIDVVMRYGVNEFTLLKWKAYFEVKSSIEEAIGRSVYDLLPGVVETTFER